MAVESVTIERTCKLAPLARTLIDISEDDDLSRAIYIGDVSFGTLHIPSTVNGTSIGFVVSTAESGTYRTLKDAANAAITITCSSATASAHPLPPELFGSPWFKIAPVTAQADTDTQFEVSLRP